MFGKKLGLTLAVALLLAACGSNSFSSFADKNSDAAKTEEAQIALNSGDSASAIAILKELCPNNGSGVPTCPTPALAKQLAGALALNAGLNLITLINTLDQASNGIAISGITQANPAVVTTASSHGLNTGEKVKFESVKGMTQLNNNVYTITVISPAVFSLNGIDSTGYGAFVSDGKGTVKSQKVDFANISTALNMSNPTNAGSIAAANLVNTQHLIDINTAIKVLQNIPNPTPDVQLQLGMAQASGAVIAIGSVTGGFDSNGFPAICAGDCTTISGAAALTSAITSNATDPTSPLSTTLPVTYVASQLSNAAGNISSSGGNVSSTTVQQSNELNNAILAGTCTSTNTNTPTATLLDSQVTSYIVNCLHY